MKKYLSLVLALALMATMAVPAFAAEDVASGNQDVTADYTEPTDIEDAPVYRVTIEWEPAADNDLAYTDTETTYTWDTDDLKYTASAETEGWTGTAAYTVTVTNYSNAAVDVAVGATAEYELTVVKSEDSAELASAAVDEEGNAIDFTNTTSTGVAQPKDFTITYSADDSAAAPDDVEETGKITIGRITVTVTGKE